MKHVLVIAYFFPPCAEGGVMRVRAFAKHLPTSQWQPIVLSVHEDYYLSFTKDEALIDELTPTTPVYRTNSFEPKGTLAKNLQASVYGVKKTGKWFDRYGKSVLRFLYRSFVIPDEHIFWLPQAIKAGIKLINQHQIDAIFVTTPPHSAAVIAAILSRISGKPLIWDVRDDWVNNPLFDAGPWYRHFIARLLEKWVVTVAKQVTTVTKESLEAFQTKYGTRINTKLRYIPNGYDQQEIGLVTKQAVSLVDRSNKMRVVYTGTLGATRTPLPLFKALQQLNKRVPLAERLALDFYGYARQEFSTACQTMGLDSVVQFHGFVSREASLQAILQADVALLIIPETEGALTAIPGKLYEYLGAHKFILALCPANSAAARLICEEELGIVTTQDNVVQLEQVMQRMLELHQDNALTLTLPEQTLQRFERSEHARQLAQILTQMTATTK